MEYPFVSVIIPVYNAQETIVKCAINLIKQSLESIELIFVDDCSTDNSYDLLKQIQQEVQKESKIEMKVIQTTKNKGPGGARNAGLELVKGQFIGFVDSDDIADTRMYEKLIQVALNEKSDIVDCGFIQEKQKSIFYPISITEAGVLDDLKRSHLIAKEGYLWNKLYSTPFIQENQLRFREKITMEDTDFLIEAYARANKISVLKEVLYQHTDNQKSLMSQINHYNLYIAAKEAAAGIYHRLALLDNWNGIRDGAEAMITALYFCAIVNCIQEKSMNTSEKEIAIRQLTQSRHQMIVERRENPFLEQVLTKESLQLLGQSELNPRMLISLLDQEKKQGI